MTTRDLVDEPTQRMKDVYKLLVRAWCREEAHKINWMAFMQSDSNFGVAFESAHAGAMTSTRVDDDHRWSGLVHAIRRMVFPHRCNTQQRIIGWSIKAPRVKQGLVLEGEHRRHAGLLVLHHDIGTSAQHVPN